MKSPLIVSRTKRLRAEASATPVMPTAVSAGAMLIPNSGQDREQRPQDEYHLCSPLDDGARAYRRDGASRPGRGPPSGARPPAAARTEPARRTMPAPDERDEQRAEDSRAWSLNHWPTSCGVHSLAHVAVFGSCLKPKCSAVAASVTRCYLLDYVHPKRRTRICERDDEHDGDRCFRESQRGARGREDPSER